MNFKNLLLGFQKALLDAQAISRDQHQRQLARYLDDEGRPLSMTIELPSSEAADGEGGQGQSRILVPLLSLIPTDSLQIRDAEIELDVDVRGLSTKGQPALEGADLDLSNLAVRAVGPPGGKGPRARLRVRFEATQLSEEELPTVDLEMLETVAAE